MGLPDLQLVAQTLLYLTVVATGLVVSIPTALTSVSRSILGIVFVVDLRVDSRGSCVYVKQNYLQATCIHVCVHPQFLPHAHPPPLVLPSPSVE